MEDVVLSVIKKQELSKENLYKYLKSKDINISEDELSKVLLNLIKKQIIFRNIYNRYQFISKDYIITTLLSDSKGNKTVKDGNDKLFINSSNLHTALKYDTVVVERLNLKEGQVVGILKRQNNKFVCEVKEKDNKL